MSVDWNLHVIATSNSDGRVRLWSPFVVEAPLSEIPQSLSHATPVQLVLSSVRSVLIVLHADTVS